MNSPSIENKISGLLYKDSLSNSIIDKKLFYIYAQRPLQKISWFLGLYVGSLLSIGGIVGGVHWMLAFL